MFISMTVNNIRFTISTRVPYEMFDMSEMAISGLSSELQMKENASVFGLNSVFSLEETPNVLRPS